MPVRRNARLENPSRAADFEIIFEDSHGNRFSSVDPEVENEGED